MTRDLKDLKVQAEKIPDWRFFDQKIRFGRFDFQLKAEIAEEFPIGNHWRGQRMTSDLASKTTLNLCNVLNVIDMSVGEQQ